MHWAHGSLVTLLTFTVMASGRIRTIQIPWTITIGLLVGRRLAT
ncbi:hypothetical protein P2L35_12785 [Enterococcus faecium]|nr:hypothetical protein [Enterococcus faecium]MDN3040568.1 hypothetical protein [Enterococcus faecium]